MFAKLKAFVHDFAQEFTAAAHDAPRIYFAPLVGIIDAVRAEIRRLDQKAGPPDRPA